MGARGPLKLPDHLAVIPGGIKENTDGKPEEPVSASTLVGAGRPIKPKSLPAAASRMWDQIVNDLEETGLLAKCDAATLELALRHYAVAVRASNSLMRSAIVKEDRKNQRQMKHPASQIFHAHSSAFLEYAKQLGLTFAARARLPISDEGGPGDNPFS